MTSIVATPAPKIVGKALYLELIANPDLSEDEISGLLGWQKAGTKQILVFPEYQDDTGKLYNATIMSRVVSNYSPRSQWDTNRVSALKPINPSELEGEDEGSYSDYISLSGYDRAEWDTLPIVAKEQAKALGLEVALRNQLIDTAYVGSGDERKIVAQQAWVVRDSKTFSVEVTDEDYQDLHHKMVTPQAVIRRIKKVRDSISSFPAKLA